MPTKAEQAYLDAMQKVHEDVMDEYAPKDHSHPEYENDDTRRTISVGPGGDFETFENAQASLGSEWWRPGRIELLNDYTAQQEAFPLTIQKRVTLAGGNYTCLKPPSDKAAIEIAMDDAPSNRPPGPHIEDLSTKGGKHGIKYTGGRYSLLRDIDVNEAESHGIVFADKTFNGEKDPACNSHHLYSVTAESNGGHGFKLGIRAHATNMFACQGYKNGKSGLYAPRKNMASNVYGGSYEQNNDHGIDVDGANSFTVDGTYIEYNGKGHDAATSGIHVAGETSNATFKNIYGNGWGHAHRLFDIRSGNNISVKNALYTQYKTGMLYASDRVKNLDVHRSTHSSLDDTPFGVSQANPTRSFGTIQPCDLTQVEGRFPGDEGVHQGTSGSLIKCVWDGQNWCPQNSSSSL